MATSPGLDAYKLGFVVSPILLVNGIARVMPGQMLPIIAITQSVDFVAGLLNGAANLDLDDFFAHFHPLPGTSLINQAVGTYPFANQATAANAVITEPNVVSMLMTCPVRSATHYAEKLATMMALKTALDSHNASGGTYTIVTPSYIYQGCVMTGMRDASSGQSKQGQWLWQIDFIKPLLSLTDAATALSSLMAKIDGGLQIAGNPTWSGLGTVTGTAANPVLPTLIPSSSSLPGASLPPTVGPGTGGLY